MHGDDDHASSCGLLQGTRKPSPPQKPLPADPLSKTVRLAGASARSPGRQESTLRLPPIRLVMHPLPSLPPRKHVGQLHGPCFSSHQRTQECGAGCVSRTPHPWEQGKTDARADLERKQPEAIDLVALSSDPSLPVRSAQDQVEQILQSSG